MFDFLTPRVFNIASGQPFAATLAKGMTRWD